MSEIKTNKISPRKGTTQTIGDSGDSVSIPCGVTTTNAGTISTAGISGGTINNTTGTISGLQQVINWDTTAKTANFNAAVQTGYFVNTTSGAITVTFPASPTAGDMIVIKDYALTADTNAITINPNGKNLNGSSANYPINIEGASGEFIYVDSTRGWVLTDASKASDIAGVVAFVAATGGTTITCGDYKTHIFTSPGTFCVSCGGSPLGSNTVDYFVVAGGGGSAGNNGGGSPGAGMGAGGFRLSNSLGLPAPTMSPLVAPTGLPVTATAYPITVGAGGAGGVATTGAPYNGFPGCNGSPSIFSTITSTGGGAGFGNPGGSGAGNNNVAGAGNTPPVSPPQGNPGGNNATGGTVPGRGPPGWIQGGGGGAGAAAPQATNNTSGPDGGIGSYIADALIGPTAPSYGTPGPVGSTRYFAGGGASGIHNNPPGSAGTGGIGGGAPGVGNSGNGNSGTVNTGGGAGGTGGSGYASNNLQQGANGGSGIVIIRYKYQ